MVAAPVGSHDFAEREAHFFARWVRDEWGRVGARFLETTLGGASAYVAALGFDGAQRAFATEVARARK
jgi:hypothetical protein